MVARALMQVATEAGIATTVNGHGAGTTITDLFARCTRSESTVVLAEPNPVSCCAAVDTVVRGDADCVLSTDRPDALPEVLDAVVRQLVVIPSSVLEAARRLPDLSERQKSILAAVMAGQSNRAIGKGLHLSEATVKREIAALLSTFSVRSRLGLATIAHEVGLTAARVH